MEISQLVDKGRVAMEEVKAYDQSQIDSLLEDMSSIILAHDEELAKMAVEETGLGRVDHKVMKNQNMANNIYNSLKGKKSVGVIDVNEETGITKIAHPVGVVGAVSPTTNPTITPMGNSLMALKGKNAVIISPHPRSLKTTHRTIELLREAIGNLGAPKDLIQMIEEPSIEKSQELMRSVDVIVATGGPGMVKAAYSSGKPAFGVGPGNVPLILDEDFDVPLAAQFAVIGRSFDNGIVCACTQSLIYPEGKEAEVIQELEKNGAYVVTDEAEVAKFREIIFKNGVSNPDTVGKDPQVIADMIGVTLPENTQIIVLKTTKSGKEELLSKEKMNPVMSLIPYKTFSEALDIAEANLKVEGQGHSAGLLSHTKEHGVEAGLRLPVSRVVVNQPTIDAGGSPNNGLTPTVSLGCGSWGNNSISENLSFTHLINISRVANFVE